MTESVNTNTVTLDDVKTALVETLGIQARADGIDASTPLLGTLPELDSLAVVELITVLQDRFDLELDEGELTADVFDTLGTLVAFVQGQAR